RAEPDHDDRAHIDRQIVIEAGARGEPHRAEEGPAGAIDRERERVDQVAPAALAAERPRAVAIARDDEQQADVAERNGDDDPALQHGRLGHLGAFDLFYRRRLRKGENSQFWRWVVKRLWQGGISAL